MSEWRTSGDVEIHIEAPPAVVYAAVADVTKTGERSSEVQSAEWLDGTATPGTVGARFRGRNKSGRTKWSRVCEVTAADPGRRFAFRTVPEKIDLSKRDSTTWAYDLVADGSGTRLTHSYEITMLPMQPFRAIYGRLLPHHRDMRPQMAETLAALKRQLEAGDRAN